MIKAEARRVLSVHTYAWLAGAAAVLAALGALSTTAAAETSQLESPLHEQQLFLVTALNAGLCALIAGIRASTDDFRHGAIAWSLLTAAHRGRFLGAKAVVLATIGAGTGAIALAAMVLVAVPIAGSRGAALELAAHDVLPMLGFVAASAAWSIIGVGAGALVRHQVASVAFGLAWIVVVENLVSTVLGGPVRRMLPGYAGYGVAQATAAGTILPVGVAAMVLAVYAAAALVVASAALDRRPVSLPPT